MAVFFGLIMSIDVGFEIICLTSDAKIALFKQVVDTL